MANQRVIDAKRKMGDMYGSRDAVTVGGATSFPGLAAPLSLNGFAPS
jgi:hypothetical protein